MNTERDHTQRDDTEPNDEHQDPRGDLAAADERSQDERPAGPSSRTPTPGRGTTLGPLPPGVKPEQADADETPHPRVAGSLRRDFARDPEHDSWASDSEPAHDIPDEGWETAMLEHAGIRSVSPVGRLLGNNIVNQEGERLGSVEDIVIDAESGRIAYVVLASGGFLGLGETLFAIPWAAVRVDTSTDQVVLNVKQEALENAPGFDKGNWPDMADPQWVAEVHSHYNYPPYWDWQSP